MEEVLEVYQRPYDERNPVVCMDEQPYELIGEIHQVKQATAKQPKRVDYEYERVGTASIFMFTEPLSGWREATARLQRTKVEWAEEVASLLEGNGRYAHCAKITLVSDNLNTHTKGAFYQAFEPGRARALVKRIEFFYTPKHGSWLNIAENELSVMTRQCLENRRIDNLEKLQTELRAWSSKTNAKQKGVDWRMEVKDARCRLKSVYPIIKM